MKIEQLDFLGKTLVEHHVSKDKTRVCLNFSDGSEYSMYHRQDCCEDVYLEDIVGDLDDLVGHPLTRAESRTTDNYESNETPPAIDVYHESWTWTFYELATAFSSVTLRWYGQSNGFYSEEVSVIRAN